MGERPVAVWPGRFANKSVIVTGGASGIGAAATERFLREGASVLVIDSDASGLGRSSALFEDAAGEGGGRFVGVCGDVTSPDDVGNMLERTLAEFGALDVLISNAGISHTEPFLGMPLANWTQHIEVNLTSMFLVCQAVGRHMAAARGGVMVLTSSTNGLVGEDRYAHYNASKGGVTLLMKSMAIELGPLGVRVNAVCPGYIVTPMAIAADTPEFMAAYVRKLPLGRLGRTEDVAGAFAFLASDDAAFITGETLVIDGGQLAY
jgi:3-oxoacyl-[acyl-carrier protein] reductase